MSDKVAYTYIQSEPSLWTVGFHRPDGQWEPESDYDSTAGAAGRVHYLNGDSCPERDALRAEIERLGIGRLQAMIRVEELKAENERLHEDLAIAQKLASDAHRDWTEVQAEHERLRAALEKIANTHDGASWLVMDAREALR